MMNEDMPEHLKVVFWEMCKRVGADPSKMNPKKYGDKTDITSNGEKINIPIIEWVKSNENSED